MLSLQKTLKVVVPISSAKVPLLIVAVCGESRVLFRLQETGIVIATLETTDSAEVVELVRMKKESEVKLIKKAANIYIYIYMNSGLIFAFYLLVIPPLYHKFYKSSIFF